MLRDSHGHHYNDTAAQETSIKNFSKGICIKDRPASLLPLAGRFVRGKLLFADK